MIVLMGHDALHAQEHSPDEKRNVWISAGLGPSFLGGIAGNASLGFRYKSFLLSLRTTANTKFEDSGLFGPVGDEFFDQALIVGYCLKERDSLASIGVGVSRVNGSRYDSSVSSGFFSSGGREDFAPIFGVPIEAQYVFILGKGFGLGIYGYANLNSEQLFGGLILNLVFGGLQ